MFNIMVTLNIYPLIIILPKCPFSFPFRPPDSPILDGGFPNASIIQ
jgi:hypothetical protein